MRSAGSFTDRPFRRSSYIVAAASFPRRIWSEMPTASWSTGMGQKRSINWQSACLMWWRIRQR